MVVLTRAFRGGNPTLVLVYSVAQVLPENLNRLLIVVVIVSMVLTPALASLGDYLGDKVEAWEESLAPGGGEMLPVPETDLTEPVVILGFNQAGQVRHPIHFLPSTMSRRRCTPGRG
jgi:hypothetical protein